MKTHYFVVTTEPNPAPVGIVNSDNMRPQADLAKWLASLRARNTGRAHWVLHVRCRAEESGYRLTVRDKMRVDPDTAFNDPQPEDRL